MTNRVYSDANLELILVSIARQYAPRLVPRDWQKPGDLKMPPHILARQLANYHVLLIMGDRGSQPSQNVPSVVQQCSDLYQTLYYLLSTYVYPTLPLRIGGQYYSYSRSQLLIVLIGESRGVIETLAGHVSPYVVERQSARAIAPAELTALIEKVLQKLEASAKDPAAYRKVRDDGAQIIKQMLGMELRQLPLTAFDEPFFSEIPHQRSKPPHLPEEKDGRVQPFVSRDGVDPASAAGTPDFLRPIVGSTGKEQAGDTAAGHEPASDHEDNGVPPDTGQHPPTDAPPRSPARRGRRSSRENDNGTQAPLPYWPKDDEG